MPSSEIALQNHNYAFVFFLVIRFLIHVKIFDFNKVKMA